MTKFVLPLPLGPKTIADFDNRGTDFIPVRMQCVVSCARSGEAAKANDCSLRNERKFLSLNPISTTPPSLPRRIHPALTSVYDDNPSSVCNMPESSFVLRQKLRFF
jgi:hypothetical protein